MQRCVLIPRSAYPAWLPAEEDAIDGILIVVSSEGLCSVSLLDYTGAQANIDDYLNYGLADPWEGFARAKGLKRPSRVLPKGVPLNVDVAAVLYAEFSGYAAETIRNAYKHVYASSWRMGAESLGMWERYGAGARGVAIESNVGRFKRALKREVRSEQYAFGGVRYHADLRTLKRDLTKGAVPASSKLWRSALEVGFNKRAFYTDENEWRAAVFQEQPLREVIGLGLPTDLDVLIETVRTGPRADVPTRYAVAQVMARTGLMMRVEESGILKPPRVRRSR